MRMSAHRFALVCGAVEPNFVSQPRADVGVSSVCEVLLSPAGSVLPVHFWGQSAWLLTYTDSSNISTPSAT